MKITLEHDDLRPLIQQVITETIEALGRAESKVPDGRLAYTESEAAKLLGIAPHALRDCRYRREVKASFAGKRILYEREELIKFLARNKAE